MQYFTIRTPASVLAVWYAKWTKTMDEELCRFVHSLASTLDVDACARVGVAAVLDPTGRDAIRSSSPVMHSLWDVSYTVFPAPPPRTCPAIAASGVTLREIKARFMLLKHYNMLVSSPDAVHFGLLRWKSMPLLGTGAVRCTHRVFVVPPLEHAWVYTVLCAPLQALICQSCWQHASSYCSQR